MCSFLNNEILATVEDELDRCLTDWRRYFPDNIKIFRKQVHERNQLFDWCLLGGATPAYRSRAMSWIMGSKVALVPRNGFPILSPTIEMRTSVMDALNSQIDETGKMIQSATRQFFDINLLPRKIFAETFGELQS